MRKRALRAVIGLTVLVLLLTLGGNQDGKSDLRTYRNTPQIIRISMSVAFSKEHSFNRFGSPDVVREVEDDMYEIRYISDGSQLITMYDSSGRIQDEWRLKRLLERSEFSGIIPGAHSDRDVKNIDPYSPPVAITADHQRAISEHRLADESTVVLYYLREDDRWIVDAVEYRGDFPFGFVNRLWPEDLEHLLASRSER